MVFHESRTRGVCVWERGPVGQLSCKECRFGFWEFPADFSGDSETGLGQNVSIQKMRPLFLDPTLLLLVCLGGLGFQTGVSSSLQNRVVECVSYSLLPVDQRSIAIESDDFSRSQDAQLVPSSSSSTVVAALFDISSGYHGLGRATVPCLGPFLRSLSCSRLESQA